ncbi:MAG TPA: SIR2 family protein [Rhizomicrobium sp.]
MASEPIHNPDQFIADLRLLLSQGRKRIAFLIGAGAPTSIRKEGGEPLIPTVKDLTTTVLGKLPKPERNKVDQVSAELGDGPNIEHILSRLRLLSRALGKQTVFGMNGAEFEILGNSICDLIGEIVNAELPAGVNPYSHLVNWITGTSRRYGVEIFTPNYDLLLEEALERVHAPYFDGFSGGVNPFFDSATVSNDDIPARWTRVWKLHGSLGWELKNGQVVRTQSRKAAHLIYPDHLKYEYSQKQPYAALFDRLKAYLRTPDSLLITCGFSFNDAHVVAAIEEALSASPLSAVIALQHQLLANEEPSVKVARNFPNLSVYAADGAVINGVQAPWKVGPAPNDQWIEIRKTFWNKRDGNEKDIFTLGCFTQLASFLAMATSELTTSAKDASAEVPTK